MITVKTTEDTEITLVAQYITSVESDPKATDRCFVSMIDGSRFGVLMSVKGMTAELLTAIRKSY